MTCKGSRQQDEHLVSPKHNQFAAAQNDLGSLSLAKQPFTFWALKFADVGVATLSVPDDTV